MKRLYKLLFCKKRPIMDWGFLAIIAFLILQSGCKKLVTVPAPMTSLNSANAYTNDAAAIAVLNGIYVQMSNNTAVHSVIPALSADELTLYDINNTGYQPAYLNTLTNSTDAAVGGFWGSFYSTIFVANNAIEGLTTSSVGLTPMVKQQLLGEAYFVRAFCYFYLVNLYGDVPLVTTTDYKTNALLARRPAATVYAQIITDLQSAQSLLSGQFLGATLLSSTIARVRPTRWAATALLARAYLYTKQYADAYAQADLVISNTSQFSLDTLNGVFLSNSNEAIWQLQSVYNGTQSNTGEGAIFVLPPTGPNTSGQYPVYLNNALVNSFEPGDLRRKDWVDSVIVGSTTYYYPYKYKIGLVNADPTEQSTLLRLGEQYLIRAEAEANGSGGGAAAAIADLNMIRKRAGLPNSTATSATLVAAILRERRVELFTEWGHRWLDLKRTGQVNAVMGNPGNACQAKGGTWNANWALYPIPLSEMQLDPNLTQNSGY
jgi:hypothetical protein